MHQKLTRESEIEEEPPSLTVFVNWQRRVFMSRELARSHGSSAVERESAVRVIDADPLTRRYSGNEATASLPARMLGGCRILRAGLRHGDWCMPRRRFREPFASRSRSLRARRGRSCGVCLLRRFLFSESGGSEGWTLAGAPSRALPAAGRRAKVWQRQSDPGPSRRSWA